jgi:hypothetical protein
MGGIYFILEQYKVFTSQKDSKGIYINIKEKITPSLE